MPTLFLLLAAGDNHIEPEVIHAEHGTPSVQVLPLSDGVCWQMNPHTRETMEQTGTTLNEAAVIDAASDRALGVTLQEKLDQRISGGTMTGADHDVRTVYVPAAQALQAITDDATAPLTALRAMIAEYDRFFA